MRVHNRHILTNSEASMKLLIFCLLAVAGTTTGVILCDGFAKDVFQWGFFGALGISAVLLLTSHFN
jgi:hypothetical protein